MNDDDDDDDDDDDGDDDGAEQGQWYCVQCERAWVGALFTGVVIGSSDGGSGVSFSKQGNGVDVWRYSSGLCDMSRARSVCICESIISLLITIKHGLGFERVLQSR